MHINRLIPVIVAHIKLIVCTKIYCLEFFTSKIYQISKNKSEVFGFGFFLGIHLKKAFNKGDRREEKNSHLQNISECIFGILDFFFPPAFFAFSLLKFQVLWHLPPRSLPLLLLLRLMARSVLILNLSMHAQLWCKYHLETIH